MDGFVEEVVRISGRNPYLCYQCGMCSAVCPVAQYMDILPHQIIRLVQMGDPAVLESDAIWVCISCMACVDRCPRDVGPGIIIDALRQFKLRRGAEKYDYFQVPELGEAPSLALVAASRKLTG